MPRAVDFAILTPTAVEFDSMCAELADARDAQDVHWPAKIGTVGAHRVAVFLSGKGEEATASSVMLIAQRYRPRWILLVGIAGGTRKMHRGDLIVANFVYSIDLREADRRTLSAAPGARLDGRSGAFRSWCAARGRTRAAVDRRCPCATPRRQARG